MHLFDAAPHLVNDMDFHLRTYLGIHEAPLLHFYLGNLSTHVTGTVEGFHRTWIAGRVISLHQSYEARPGKLTNTTGLPFNDIICPPVRPAHLGLSNATLVTQTSSGHGAQKGSWDLAPSFQA
jgi:hypothetical protein